MQRQNGFTLLEVLAVLAIVGILMGIFGWNLIRSIRTAELREAATQVATDLRRARSQAQRGSADVTLILPGTAGSATYTVNGVGKTLPNKVKLLCKTASACGADATINVVYQAPYGELGATGSVYTVRSPISGIDDLEIRIVGVTGKIILTKAGS